MTEAELARITGTPPDELRRWRDLGLLRPDPSGALGGRSAARVQLIRFALARGIELERMSGAVAEQPDLLDLFEVQIGAAAGPEYSLEETRSCWWPRQRTAFRVASAPSTATSVS